MTVVGEQATNGDAQGGVVGQRGAQEGDGRSGGEVGEDLSESNAGVVIDGDMNIFPSAVKPRRAASATCSRMNSRQCFCNARMVAVNCGCRC